MAYKLTLERINQIDDNLIITGYLNEISYYLRELKKDKDKNTEDEEKQLKKTRVALYSHRKRNGSKLKTSDRRHQIDDCGERIDEDYYQFRVTGRNRGGQGLGKNADQRALKNRHLYKIRGNIFIEYE